MLKDLNEYGKSLREEMKALLRERKNNPQETNSERKEGWIQINDLGFKKEIIYNQKKMEKQEFKKTKRV